MRKLDPSTRRSQIASTKLTPSEERTVLAAATIVGLPRSAFQRVAALEVAQSVLQRAADGSLPTVQPIEESVNG